VLGEFGRAVTPAQNTVVVQSELGSAPAIGRAIDRLEHALIVGTLAGDDTCLVIARDTKDASTLARELERLLG
jgi:transcriptional regulator of arginine metabolism